MKTNSHNRLVVGSNPTEPISKANSTQNATEYYEKSHVLTKSLPPKRSYSYIVR